MTMASLETALGHAFTDPALLEQALTHRSHGAKHNERLEFLGDAVLNMVVASLLFTRFAHLDEGTLTRLRANLVKQATLAELAADLALPAHLRLGEGEMKSGGFRRPSILADALEAILGAVYLDAGFETVVRVIARLYDTRLSTLDPHTQGKDAKTGLQELLQARKLDLPTYQVVATHGAAHDQTFEVACLIPALDIHVTAGGGSRRAAEQAAARLALQALERQAPSVRKSQSSRARKSAKQLSLPVAVAQNAV